MDNSIYIALSRQGAMFRKMDVIAENMANVNTTSYKANEMMLTDWTVPNGNRQHISFTQDIGLFRNPKSGAMQETGNSLDVALDGSGFFTVETAQGTRYTRAGEFKLDPSGTLMTTNGNPILDSANQRITIPEDAVNIEFGDDGTIKVDGIELARLNLVNFANEQKLERVSGMLYKANDIQPIPAEGCRVIQGFLEQSNVESVVELAEMIKTSRGVTGVSKFMETAYDLQRRAMGAWAKEGMA